MIKGKHILSKLIFRAADGLRFSLEDSQNLNMIEQFNQRFNPQPPKFESLCVKGVLIDRGGLLCYFDFNTPIRFESTSHANERLVVCVLDDNTRHIPYDVALVDISYIKVTGTLSANLETGILNISNASYAAFNTKQERITINECQLIIDGEVTLL